MSGVERRREWRRRNKSGSPPSTTREQVKEEASVEVVRGAASERDAWTSLQWMDGWEDESLTGIVSDLLVGTVPKKDQFEYVKGLTGQRIKDLIVNSDVLLGNIADAVMMHQKKLVAQAASTATEMNNKFSTAESFNFGDRDTYEGGLQRVVGPAKYLFDMDGKQGPDFLRSVWMEHQNETEFSTWNYGITTSPQIEFECVCGKWSPGSHNFDNSNVVPPTETKNVRDFGGRMERRKLVPLEDLMKHSACKEANLNHAEVVVGRLWTGPMYEQYNLVLRTQTKDRFTTTLHVLNSLIIKLSKIAVPETLYRGLANRKLLPDFFDVKAGGSCEYGAQSFSPDRNVTLGYASTDQGSASYLFEVQESQIDKGADLSWLSYYVGEKEKLYPPLCMLQPESARIEGQVVIIKLRINVCQKTLTLEELVGRSKSLQMELFRHMYGDIDESSANKQHFRRFLEMKEKEDVPSFSDPYCQLDGLETAIQLKGAAAPEADSLNSKARNQEMISRQMAPVDKPPVWPKGFDPEEHEKRPGNIIMFLTVENLRELDFKELYECTPLTMKQEWTRQGMSYYSWRYEHRFSTAEEWDYATGKRQIDGDFNKGRAWERDQGRLHNDPARLLDEVNQKIKREILARYPNIKFDERTHYLTMDEFLAGRVYTSPAGSILNTFCRALFNATEEERKVFAKYYAYTWAATLKNLTACMRKLALITPVCTLYRILSGLKIPAKAMKPGCTDNIVCYVQPQITSCNTDKKESLGYNTNRHDGLLFEIECAPADELGVHNGASLEVLSQYPAQKEVTFPPLAMFRLCVDDSNIARISESKEPVAMQSESERDTVFNSITRIVVRPML
jgi:hypothetical protein